MNLLLLHRVLYCYDYKEKESNILINKYGAHLFHTNNEEVWNYINKFSKWKTKFFRLENVDKYNVWLCGGFVESWKTLDVDIVLTNKPIYSELQKLMLDAIKLGVEKNIFIDIYRNYIFHFINYFSFFNGEITLRTNQNT